MEILDQVLKWIVAPIVAFVWLIYREQAGHSTELAVLKAEAMASKEAHYREILQMQNNFASVFAKLDNIEKALRK